MKPEYSVIYFKENLSAHMTDIGNYLREGIKVFWFGKESECRQLLQKYEKFKDAFFLQIYDISQIPGNDSLPVVMILDGEGITEDVNKKKVFDWLEENLYSFNAAQYKVEHFKPNGNIVVKASAGTGKTTVMIDRILFLMQMVPGLRMSDIYMITFTNEATNQMNDRLQAMLLKKYSLTKNKKYLTWLEQQSQMHISTIDSLAYDLFRRFGTGVGFGRDLQIQPLEKERKDVIKDLLSDALNDKHAISTQLSMSYSEASTLIDTYWRELTRKGYTISEVLEKDWGELDQEPVLANFQRIIKEVLGKFEEQYRQLKLDTNAISINDLFFDFGHYLLEERLNCDGLDMKYLFVDEFQDTDATQIRTFARLVQKIGANLFVVGDSKQSIYGFKGATNQGFRILAKELNDDLKYFNLRNNYRTCNNIMKLMEEYFMQWSDRGLLEYEEEVRPIKKESGTVSMELLKYKSELPDMSVNMIRHALRDLEDEVRAGKKKLDDKAKVAVLFRSNPAAVDMAKLCRKHGIPVVLNSDRPFFLSRAVRDVYAMISSYIFVDHPVYTYNYLLTPYAVFDGEISIAEMERLKGNHKELNEYLMQFLKDTKWHKYQREFRIKPVLSVLKDMVNDTHLIENFIASDKKQLTGPDWTEAKRNRQALNDARSYQLNLDKLIEMLQQRLNGEFTTLYDIYIFLSLMIATNRGEMEPDVDMETDYKSAYIMTVHKSKGLEFDTVILPDMNNRLIPKEKTAILANEEKVAWYYKGDNDERIKSAWYTALRTEAEKNGREEETRMLYVAMTRAVNRLYLIVNNWDNYESWSSLIRKVGLKNE